MRKLRKPRYKAAYLEVRTYKGTICWWAKHFYGKLRCEGYEPVDLEHELSAAQARRMTKEDEGYTYEKGDISSRYETKDELIQQAVSELHDHFPDAEILIYGGFHRHEPQPILVGPPDLIDEVQRLYDRAVELGWEDGGHEGQVNEIIRQWKDLMYE
jgi:hypothetical protein